MVVKVLSKEGVDLPVYSSLEAAGADLRAFIDEKRILKKGESTLVPTGLFMEIPQGYELQIRPRSGLALKSQITVLNSPGTIDSDYRGEIQVILINHGQNDFVIEPGMRIAQMVLSPVVKASFTFTQEIKSSLRGDGGFGHTGSM
ncbi:MAG: dUTP diphosphatase [Rhabdochlamydiaceae bacterium]